MGLIVQAGLFTKINFAGGVYLRGTQMPSEIIKMYEGKQVFKFFARVNKIFSRCSLSSF